MMSSWTSAHAWMSSSAAQAVTTSAGASAAVSTAAAHPARAKRGSHPLATVQDEVGQQSGETVDPGIDAVDEFPATVEVPGERMSDARRLVVVTGSRPRRRCHRHHPSRPAPTAAHVRSSLVVG